MPVPFAPGKIPLRLRLCTVPKAHLTPMCNAQSLAELYMRARPVTGRALRRAMAMNTQIETSKNLRNVRYEIRGRLAQRAHEMERQGYEIVSLNIGNPGLFGFRTPETMRMAMIENLPSSEASVSYTHLRAHET